MQTYNGMPVEYIGDGVYALYDGHSIWLHANDHANPTDKICLEPPVMIQLNRFYDTVTKPPQINKRSPF